MYTGLPTYSPLPSPTYRPFVVQEAPAIVVPSSVVTSPDRSSQVHHPSKRREFLAWVIIFVQALVLVCLLQGNAGQHSFRRKGEERFALTTSEKTFNYHYDRFLDAKEENTAEFFHEPPTIYLPRVSRVWHSNKSPNVNEGLKTGSCWCSADDYCMCTPLLATDVILTCAGSDDLWLIKREDTGKFALVGGFNEVGETVEEACRREMREEVGINLPDIPLKLIGVYSDPRRDHRKHPVSVVFHMELPSDIITLIAGDDAKEVIRLPLSEVENLESMHTDHKTILLDFMGNHM